MKTFVKNADEWMYEKVEFETEKVLESARRYREHKLKPTSVCLDELTTQKLKSLAAEKGIPYQVLMRSFILDGLRRIEDDKKVG